MIPLIQSFVRAIMPLRLHLLTLAVVGFTIHTSQFADISEQLYDNGSWIITTTAFCIVLVTTAFRIAAFYNRITLGTFVMIALLGTVYWLFLLDYRPHLTPTIQGIPEGWTPEQVADWNNARSLPDRFPSHCRLVADLACMLFVAYLLKATAVTDYLHLRVLIALRDSAVTTLFGTALYSTMLHAYRPDIFLVSQTSLLVTSAASMVIIDLCWAPAHRINTCTCSPGWDQLTERKEWSLWLTPFMPLAKFASIRLSPYVSTVSLIALPLVTLVLLSRSSIATHINACLMVLLGLTLWLLVLTELQTWSHRLGVPLLTLLAAWLIILSAFGWNYHHNVRVLEGLPPTVATDVRELFHRWINTRSDISYDPMQPYPVFLVAAEGGGIRATYVTLALLSALQREYPSFAHHLFAISGVSGGAVGAAYFYAIQKAAHAGLGGHNTIRPYDLIADKNFLSGPVATLFGPEILQRLLPTQIFGLGGIPFFSRFEEDRAIALESGIETAFEGLTPVNALKDDFCSSYVPTQDAPLLLLNATDVDSGKRVVLTPARIFGDSNAFYPVQDDPYLHMRLSTAAVLSARFPIISPVGELRLSAGQRFRLVDGGYSDNTGTETIAALIRELSSVAEQLLRETPTRRVAFFVLSAKFSGPPPQDRTFTPASFEFVPVIEALLNSRARLSASSEILALTMQSLGPRIPYACVDVPVTSVLRYQPFGWNVSSKAATDIDFQIANTITFRAEALIHKAAWPPEVVDVHQAYLRSLDANLEILRTKRIDVDRPDFGMPLHVVPWLASMKTGEWPKLMAWCDLVVNSSGEALPYVPEGLFDALSALRNARQDVLEPHPFTRFGDDDLHMMRWIRMLNDPGGRSAPGPLRGLKEYAEYARSLKPLDDALFPEGGPVWRFDEYCKRSWEQAIRRYNDALKSLDVLNTPESLQAKQTIRSELEQLTDMYERRWKSKNPYKGEK
jgi:hypothetical protein